MVKFIAVIRIKPGYDPDETWQIWTKEHAQRTKKTLGADVRKYTIQRVIKPLNDTDVFGVAEMLFDDLATCERAMKRVWAAEPDEFWRRCARVDRVVVEGMDI